MFLDWKSQCCEMTILPKPIYRFIAILIKIAMTFFTELEQKIVQFVWKNKRPWIVKAILRKKNWPGGINLSDFRLYYKVEVIKKIWFLHKDKNTHQQNKIESPEINQCTYGYLVFDKEQECTMEERQPLQQVVLGKLES